MRVFVDTSGLFALLAGNDKMHQPARAAFHYLSQRDARLITSSYVLVETVALLLYCIGLAAVQDFHAKIVPLLEFIWVDSTLHDRAMQRLLMSRRRDLSLVDCLSLEIIELKEIQFALAFDKHFQEHGIQSVTPDVTT
jgi:predicted nucleic acid-binding protein